MTTYLFRCICRDSDHQTHFTEKHAHDNAARARGLELARGWYRVEVFGTYCYCVGTWLEYGKVDALAKRLE